MVSTGLGVWAWMMEESRRAMTLEKSARLMNLNLKPGARDQKPYALRFVSCSWGGRGSEKRQSKAVQNIPIAKPCVYTSITDLPRNSMFSIDWIRNDWTRNLKFRRPALTIPLMMLALLSLTVGAPGLLAQDQSEPAARRAEAGSAARGRRPAERRRALRHPEKEGRTAATTAPSQTEES